MSTPVMLADCVFVVTENQRYEKIAKNDILYVQAEGAWVDIVTVDRTYLVSTNLGTVEPQLDTYYFGRISRKHIINLHRIDSVQGNEVMIYGKPLVIGRQYREGLLSRLPIIRTRIERPEP